MKTAIYPGSFDPWHDEHADVLKKILEAFDNVIIAVKVNPENRPQSSAALFDISEKYKYLYQVSVVLLEGSVVDLVKETGASAVICGVRNGQYLEYEQV